MKTQLVSIRRVSDSKGGEVNYQVRLRGEVEGASNVQQSSFSKLLQLSNIGDDRFAGRKMLNTWYKITPEAVEKVYADFLKEAGEDVSKVVARLKLLEVNEVLEFGEEGHAGVYITVDGKKYPLSLEVKEYAVTNDSAEQANTYEVQSGSPYTSPTAKHIVDNGEIKFMFTQNSDGTVSPIYRKVLPTFDTPNNVYLPIIRDEEGKPVFFTIEQVKADEQNKYSVKADAVVAKSEAAKVLSEV